MIKNPSSGIFYSTKASHKVLIILNVGSLVKSKNKMATEADFIWVEQVL